MRHNLLLVAVMLAATTFSTSSHARCDYPDDRDSAGNRCGGRAASVRPGGRLGGDGNYTDSQGRNRIYGRDNDPYDSNTYGGYGSQKRNNSQQNSWPYR